MDNPNNQVTFVNFFFNSNKHILYNKVMTYKIANVPHLLQGVVIFSKVTEHFVVEWLLEIIGPKLDFRQYGGLKGNSITHYVIEFINFVLSCQDSNDQTAVIASFVDFQKAFMRQNHNKLIEKLSDLDVPGWLLKIVIGFLKQRSMVVIYKGSQSSVKQLPGGGPQGTLLALLLFLVLVNDVGFVNQWNNA